MRTPFLLFLFALAFLSGLLAVLQATVNQQLGLILGLGTLATVISFAVGLLLLTLLVFAEARYYHLPLLCSWTSTPHPSLFLGGPIGVAFVTSSVFITLYIGFSLYYLFLVTGQLAAAVVADAHGFGVRGGVKIPATLPRLLLLLLSLVGVLLSVLEALQGSSAAFPPSSLGWCALSLLTGAATLVQSVLNRRAALLLPSKLQATWWSFAVGTALALLVFGIQAASLGGTPALAATLARRAGELAFIHFIGGLLGVAFVFAAIFVPELLGSQAFSIALVSGQLVGSAALDSVGLLGVEARVLSPVRLAGVVLVLCAAAGMQLPCAAPPPAPPAPMDAAAPAPAPQLVPASQGECVVLRGTLG